jgi:hypothetical protein
VAEPTMAQRIVRAKRALSEARVPSSCRAARSSERSSRACCRSCILLMAQDRSRWDRELIARGLAALEQAGGLAGQPGPYQLQAEIAASHARASSPEATDWNRIAELHETSHDRPNSTPQRFAQRPFADRSRYGKLPSCRVTSSGNRSPAPTRGSSTERRSSGSHRAEPEPCSSKDRSDVCPPAAKPPAYRRGARSTTGAI